ncbi:hypothetical protein [Rhizobium sp. N324]|uniref:hypothetical protein n=1 Tax=Rhizobium sp. N324 TaxID=1703969 RepID=UPI0007EA8D17|nr:hypothetical protein [Rhizobium sp. N324]ANM12086.1 hypothetical protein AMK05_CH03737 [Rhizobium sp. N324]
MAEIVHFPARGPRPALRLVSDIDDMVTAEMNAKCRDYIAKALENMASANLELNAANVILLDQGDTSDLVSDEVIISMCHALISVIDARGCRTDDRPLRNAAAKTISEREGSHHGH